MLHLDKVITASPPNTRSRPANDKTRCNTVKRSAGSDFATQLLLLLEPPTDFKLKDAMLQKLWVRNENQQAREILKRRSPGPAAADKKVLTIPGLPTLLTDRCNGHATHTHTPIPPGSFTAAPTPSSKAQPEVAAPAKGILYRHYISGRHAQAAHLTLCASLAT